MFSSGEEQVGKWRCSLKTWVGVCVWLSYRCQIHCVECFCGQKQSDRLNRMSLPMLPMNNLWHLVASERVVVHDSVDQSDRERRKSSENFSPLGSVQCCCLIDQSQHWIEWAESFFLLSRSPCWLIVSVNSPQWPRKKSNSDKKFLLNLDLLVRGVLQLLDWLLFIGTSGPPRKQNSYLISFCIENTILQFIISTTFFLVFLSFFILTTTHPCLCFTVLRSVCYVVSDQSAVADTSCSSDKNFIGQLTIASFHRHRFDWFPAGVTDRVSMRPCEGISRVVFCKRETTVG